MTTELDVFVASHPELHHYTNFDGLKGIFETRTLWASHYQYVNDSLEMKALAAHLEKALSKRLFVLAQRACDSNLPLRARKCLQTCKDPIEFAYVHAGALVDALQECAFEGRGAYITSFCSHHGDNSYAKINGILSQWRAYGHNDRCCLVFDTKRLADLLRREARQYYWNFITCEEVSYLEDEDAFNNQFETFLSHCEAIVSNLLFRGTSDGLTKTDFEAFLHAACTMKDPAFKEEREVRLVAIPAFESDVANARKLYGPVPQRLFKTFHTRSDGSRDIPYLRIFDCFHEELPIKRVIVGPSGHQQEEYRKVLDMLAGRADVTLSAIPFIG